MNRMIVNGQVFSMEEAVRAGYMKPSRHVDDKQEKLKTRREDSVAVHEDEEKTDEK